jgi:cell wall-associated NlpC family hydrolase
MRDALGSLAGAQYRSGGLDPSLALLFSDDPDDYLDKAAVLDRISSQQAGRAQGTAGRHARSLPGARGGDPQARRTGQEPQGRRPAQAHRRAETVQGRQLLNAMPLADRAAYDRASRSSRQDIPDLGGAVPSSGRAAAAVAAARSAVGRPYVWGANGPGGFDCSGLTSGRTRRPVSVCRAPRRPRRTPAGRCPLSQAQPGDIVTYRGDASHVGMYVGNGQVIHAPYPGAPVRYDPVGMMPVNTVTRP